MAGISQRPSWAEVHKSHRPQREAGIKLVLSLAGDPPAHQQSGIFPFPRFGCVFPVWMCFPSLSELLRESWKMNPVQKTQLCPSVPPPTLLTPRVCMTRAQSQHQALHPMELLQIYPTKEIKSLQTAPEVRIEEEKRIRH